MNYEDHLLTTAQRLHLFFSTVSPLVCPFPRTGSSAFLFVLICTILFEKKPIKTGKRYCLRLHRLLFGFCGNLKGDFMFSLPQLRAHYETIQLESENRKSRSLWSKIIIDHFTGILLQFLNQLHTQVSNCVYMFDP